MQIVQLLTASHIALRAAPHTEIKFSKRTGHAKFEKLKYIVNGLVGLFNSARI